VILTCPYVIAFERVGSGNPMDGGSMYNPRMFLSGITGSALALASSVVYGAGDFLGGLAARRLHPFQVLTFGSATGLVLMVLMALMLGEELPTTFDLVWAGLAGVCGMFGLAALYQGLAQGESAIVSPVSGVVGAGLPVVVGIILEGLPSPLQVAGFACAAPGIWLVTLQPGGSRQKVRAGILLGGLAGIGFGLFFTLIAQVESSATFYPLAFLKLVALTISGGVWWFSRKKYPRLDLRQPAAWLAAPVKLAVASGLLDPLANALYLAATRLARLDVAVVLTSLYPAVTVLLSWLVLKEKIILVQWLGVAFCLAAIVLITL
jgi:drug/metabolite transporter (DMT)-like permease